MELKVLINCFREQIRYNVEILYRRNHHGKELDLTKHDVSKTLGVLRQIIGLTGPKVSKNLKFDYNNKIISDDTEIANALKAFFLLL